MTISNRNKHAIPILAAVITLIIMMTAAFATEPPPQLGTLTDIEYRKVELLREQNQYLERIARALESIDRRQQMKP